MPTLEITTVVRCPVMCSFCPQDKLQEAYDSSSSRVMQLEDFRTIISKLPPYVRIDFSGFSEPWSNRRATQMLETALASGFYVSVYTTLIGMRDPERVCELLASHSDQVETIVIHLPDASGNMTKFSRTAEYDLALEKFKELRDSGVLRSFDMMTMDDGDRVADGVAAESSSLWLPLSRAGNVAAVEGQTNERAYDHRTPLSCSYTPFYDHNVVLPDGSVVLCCMDYSMEHRLGNLLRDSYWDLFRSQELAELRVKNMHFGENDSLCRKCSRAHPHHLREEKQFWR